MFLALFGGESFRSHFFKDSIDEYRFLVGGFFFFFHFFESICSFSSGSVLQSSSSIERVPLSVTNHFLLLLSKFFHNLLLTI